MALLLLVAGLAIAPTLIAAVSLIQEPCRPAASTRGWPASRPPSWSGVAPGAAVGGLMVDRAGASASYAVAACAAGVGAVVGILMTLLHRPARIDPLTPAGTSGGPR